MNALWNQALAWKIAIGWFVLFSLNALATSMIAALTGADWATLDSQAKFEICLAVFANWTGTIMAFLSKVNKQVSTGSNPFDTNTFTKADVSASQQTTKLTGS